jgi:TolA-binding protein
MLDKDLPFTCICFAVIGVSSDRHPSLIRVPAGPILLRDGRAWLRAALGVVLGAAVAWGQDMSGLRTTELQQRVQQGIDRQAFAAVRAELVELNRRYRESADPAMVQAREGILYYLGLARLQAADLGGAEETLRELLAAYPEARQAVFARLYLGDALYYQNKLAEARVAYDDLRARHDFASLDPTQRVGFWDRLSDCYFAAQDWAAAEPVFRELAAAARVQFDASLAAEKTTKAAAYLLQAAIAQDQLAAALAALPALSARGGEARHDLSLNLALLQGGDRLYEAARYGEALFFYEQVLTPPQLTAYWSAEEARLEARLIRVADIDFLAGQRNELASRLALARARREQVETAFGAEQGHYTDALRFRIARCYLARERHHEGYWAFARLAEEDSAGAADFAEDAWYGRVITAAGAARPERLRAAAATYLGRREFERFLGDVGHELLQLETRADRPAEVVRLCGEFLDRVAAQPVLREGPKLIYLVGSHLVAMEELAELRRGFEALLARHPDSSITDGVLYWLGMAAIFEGDFAGARRRFEALLALAPRGSYAEDARYRVGVCEFGLLNYPEARRQLEAFLTDYPASPLVSEAQALLGDLAAAEGRIEDAMTAYAAAERAGAALSPPNYPYINHAIFQAGRLLAANERWDRLADWFNDYINRWGPRAGRLADALYQLGRAQEALGRVDEMLESYLRAILRFGNDPADHGPDLMLAEFPAKYAAFHGEPPTATLHEALARAEAQGETTLVLRLAYTLHAMGAATADTPRAFADQLDHASPAVLVAIAREERSYNPDLARQAAETAVARAPHSPFAEEAWHLIAALRARAGDAAGALAAYAEIGERFPTSRRTAVARLRAGDLLREADRRPEALESYRSVLQNRQWRGEPWAKANFKIGLTHLENGSLEEAFGFFQRVYVLYVGVPEWSSQAYLHSGLALERLGRVEDARRTYGELLAHETLRGTPAAREARRRLAGLP